MAGRVGRHLARNAVAYVALFIALSGGAYAAVTVGSAQVANNSLRSVDIRNRGITGVDIARRTLRAEHFRPGVLRRAQGPAGPKGDPGAPGAAGPSFGDGSRVPNVQDIPCNAPTVVGALPLTVAQPSRIWTQAQGALRRDGSTATDYALWLRLRNAADTATLATTMAAWDGAEPLTAEVVQKVSEHRCSVGRRGGIGPRPEAGSPRGSARVTTPTRDGGSRGPRGSSPPPRPPNPA